ncbi:MAG: thiamine pyrophosphate-binding protein [Proteobacteria bacterium]|nr:thiamine pyrophosphate-binding protein [Pseudomonadota bacterium]
MARAANVLAESLKVNGVDRVFCVPGESYLAVLDALYDIKEIDVVTSRHEGGGAFMAVADAKMTGRTGVMFASRGPGSSNASIGVHVAQQDAVPLILFVGQVARVDLGRRAFQEVDYKKFFSDFAKYIEEVTDADQLAEVVQRAFQIAQSGTPGPVVISLPEDMLDDETENGCLPPLDVSLPAPRDGQIQDICDRISKAERPVLFAGNQMGSAAGRAALQAVSELWNIPVVVSWRHQDLFDNRHPNFAAHLAFNMPKVFAERLNESDLVVAIGTRLNDVTTQGYTIPTAPKPQQPLVHVYGDGAELGRVFETDLAVEADAVATLQAMAKVNAPSPPPGRAEWISHVHALSAERMEWDNPKADDGVVFGNVVTALAERLDDDAVIVNDAGNFSTWVHRLYPFKPTNMFLGAVAGSMGVGVPFAVAGALRAEEGRQIVTFVGDGGFQMTGNELAVAVERNLPVKIFVSNNGTLGTIRLYQERDYPDRTIATDLRNPDFADLATAYGATGLRINSDADIEPVIEQAMATAGPVVVEVATSLEYIAAYSRLSAIRKAALS